MESSSSTSPALILKSDDDEVFKLTEEMASFMGLFKDMLQLTDHDGRAATKDAKDSDSNNDNNISKQPTANGSSKTNEEKDDELAYADPPINCKVDSATMKLVLEWLEHHKADTEVITGIDDDAFREREMPAWDATFFKGKDWDTLLSLLMAANYLNINNLHFYTGKAIANNMSGMSTEQMRQYVHSDWTGPIPDAEEEEEKVVEESSH